MTGVSHTKAVTTIRKAKGLVRLMVSRPPGQNPNTYMAYLPINTNKCNGNTGTGAPHKGKLDLLLVCTVDFPPSVFVFVNRKAVEIRPWVRLSTEIELSH